MNIVIDMETRSRVDLKSAGMYRYAEDESTDIVCISLKAGDHPAVLWIPDKFHHIAGSAWLTDLFLDMFVHPDGRWTVMDEDEFEEAREKGLMDEGIARNARAALEEITAKAAAGEWPPDIVGRVPKDPLRTLRSVMELEKP